MTVAVAVATLVGINVTINKHSSKNGYTALAGQTAVRLTAFGWCDGMDPNRFSDPETIDSEPLPDGATIQLRYSRSAQCAWGKIINGRAPDKVGIHRLSDGKELWASTGAYPTTNYTYALDDAGVQSKVIGCDSSGCTATPPF
ncbi:DUF2690 domain-containing protein [Gandjariella thermophila]|uniref:DUF2690 domain-containing protein n=1 Tax=Gandjariella thermophila TaxID=1931992 RepID=UPI001864A685|nr:DUF2690 domain-containing protein [Gandjariella thermophila]